MHLSNSVSDELVGYLSGTRIWNNKAAHRKKQKNWLVKKIPFDEVVGMMESGMITDAMSVAAIQKIQLMIYQGKLKR